MSIYDFIKLNSPEEFIEGLEKDEREFGKEEGRGFEPEGEREVGKVEREGEREGEIEQEGERKFYVYAYFCPETHEPFYIGKGTGKRAWKHITEVVNNTTPTNRLRFSKIKRILEGGGEPIVRILFDGLLEDESLIKEASLIAHYGRKITRDGVLCNMAEYGLSSGAIRDTTEYTLINVHTNEVFTGTQQQIQKELGLLPSESSSVVSGKSNSAKGWKLTGTECRVFNMGVYHFTNIKNGEEVWETQKDFSEKYQVSASCVSGLVSGKKKLAKGWCFGVPTEEMKEEFKEHVIVSLDGGRETGTIKELIAITGTTKIREVINGTRNHANGWFLDEITEEKLKGLRVNGGSPTIYSFFNKTTGERFTGTRVEFSAHSGFNHKKVHKMVRVKGMTTRCGWTIKY